MSKKELVDLIMGFDKLVYGYLYDGLNETIEECDGTILDMFIAFDKKHENVLPILNDTSSDLMAIAYAIMGKEAYEKQNKLKRNKEKLWHRKN